MDTTEEALRWQQMKSLLADALDRPAGQRQSFVDAATAGDAVMRSTLIELVAAAATENSVLDAPPSEMTLEALQLRATAPWIGRRLGPYRLVELIAGGGMGQVYLAERADGQYEQRVAIKLMRDGLDRTTLVSRFKAERQILASLEHPNLAKMLDGGITEEGVPYLVMELVKGEPIDAYCRARDLSINERLKLFRTVCQVVHYAHQHGVIHRDLKAANILVTQDGVVKLVDFGIAKRLTVEPAAATVTMTSQRAMTLDHASPEQVRGDAVTPASDIFSLGVVLYRLLAGVGPYPVNIGEYELTRAICDIEPRPPSTRVDRSTRRQLRGDVDAVVMLALRKDPSKRYASAEQFGDDLFRHIEGLPVQARRGAWSYRAGRFLLRHKIAVAAALVANLALAAGLALAGYEAYQAQRERREAEVQQKRAEKHFASVRHLANVFIFEVHDAISELPGSTPARKLVVENALSYLQQLGAEASGDPSLQIEIAAGYRKVGNIQGQPDMANLGDPKGAVESYRKACALLEPLVGSSEAKQQLPSMRQAKEELLRVYRSEGGLLSTMGRFQEADAVLAAGVHLAQALATEPHASEEAQFELARMLAQHSRLKLHAGSNAEYIRLGDRSAAVFDAVLARSPQHRRAGQALAAHYLSRGEYFMSLDSPTAPVLAQEALNKAVDLLQRLHVAHPDSTVVTHYLAIGRYTLGAALQRTGKPAQAAIEQRAAIEMLAALTAQDPSSVPFRVDQATAYSNLGDALFSQGDVAGSITALHSAFELLDRLPKDADTLSMTRYRRGEAHYRLARALERRAESAKACQHYREALSDIRALVSNVGPAELQASTIEQAIGHCS